MNYKIELREAASAKWMARAEIITLELSSIADRHARGHSAHLLERT